MSNIFKSLLIFFTFFFLSTHVAMAEDYPEKVVAKLGNGLANTITGFVEIPKTILILSHEETPVYGATVGLLAGFVHMIGRTLYGAIDVATFLIPTKPLIEPDYVWKDFEKITTYHADWQIN